MAEKKPLCLYGDTVKELQSGDLLDGMAAIGTSPYPQTNVSSINANASTVHTITLLNFIATNVYTVVSNDTNAVNVSRSGDTITATLTSNTSGNSLTTSIFISSLVSGDSVAGVISIPVTNHSINTTDDAIIVSDFTLVDESVSGFTFSGGALLSSTAANNIYTSLPVDQGVLDADWSSCITNVTCVYKELPVYGYHPDTMTKLMVPESADFVIGDVVQLKKQNGTYETRIIGSITSVPLSFTSTMSLGSDTDNALTWRSGFSLNAMGTYGVTYQSGSQYMWDNMTSWDTDGLNTATGVAVNFPTGHTFTPERFFITACGKYMYVAPSDSSQLMYQYALTTPHNPTVITTVSSAILNSVPLTSGTGLYVSPNGKYLYMSEISGSMVQYEMTTPFNITTAIIVASVTNIPTLGLQLTADGKYLLTAYDNGTTTGVKAYSLGTQWMLGTVGGVVSTYSSTGIPEATPKSLVFKPDSTKLYVVGTGLATVLQHSLGSNFLARKELTLNTAPSELPITISLINNNSIPLVTKLDGQAANTNQFTLQNLTLSSSSINNTDGINTTILNYQVRNFTDARSIKFSIESTSKALTVSNVTLQLTKESL